jgi:hypothetical protein
MFVGSIFNVALFSLFFGRATASHGAFNHGAWVPLGGTWRIMPDPGPRYVQLPNGHWTIEPADPPPVLVSTAEGLQAAVSNETVRHILLDDVWFNFTRDGSAPTQIDSDQYGCVESALCVTRRLTIGEACGMRTHPRSNITP